MDRKSDQRDEVGEDAFAAGAFDLGFFQRGVAKVDGVMVAEAEIFSVLGPKMG